jgi:hypothetical protein
MIDDQSDELLQQIKNAPTGAQNGAYRGVEVLTDRKEDIRLLRACLTWADEHEDDRSESWRDAFESMLARLLGHPDLFLTETQRTWVHDIHEKLFDEPTYENAWSAGKIAEGAALKTPTPEVLKKPLPMKPPARRQ